MSRKEKHQRIIEFNDRDLYVTFEYLPAEYSTNLPARLDITNVKSDKYDYTNRLSTKLLREIEEIILEEYEEEFYYYYKSC